MLESCIYEMVVNARAWWESRGGGAGVGWKRGFWERGVRAWSWRAAARTGSCGGWQGWSGARFGASSTAGAATHTGASDEYARVCGVKSRITVSLCWVLVLVLVCSVADWVRAPLRGSERLHKAFSEERGGVTMTPHGSLSVGPLHRAHAPSNGLGCGRCSDALAIRWHRPRGSFSEFHAAATHGSVPFLSWRGGCGISVSCLWKGVQTSVVGRAPPCGPTRRTAAIHWWVSFGRRLRHLMRLYFDL